MHIKPTGEYATLSKLCLRCVVLSHAHETNWRVRNTEQALLAMCCLYISHLKEITMKYQDMIKTENTDNRYQAWTQYRSQLTSYITTALKDNIPSDGWVAIWGAGGCNDIDIVKLSKDYKLLLIDRDIETLELTRNRLCLSKDRCKIADVAFWSIDEEDYKLFESLIIDRADQEELEIFLRELVEHMPNPANLEKYQVDCSVVVGLASQLNARLAALLYMHKDKLGHVDMNGIQSVLDSLNKIAVERLYVALRQLTKTLIITGYELESLSSVEEAETRGAEYAAGFETGMAGGSFLSGEEEKYITVAGNEHWHRRIYKAILMDKLEELGLARIMYWNFSEQKTYIMLNIALLVC